MILEPTGRLSFIEIMKSVATHRCSVHKCSVKPILSASKTLSLSIFGNSKPVELRKQLDSTASRSPDLFQPVYEQFQRMIESEITVRSVQNVKGSIAIYVAQREIMTACC